MAEQHALTPTQEDREVAWHYNDFHCQPDRQMRDRWFAGYYDNQPQGDIIRVFMRHRLAAEERGKRMALEAAAKVADQWCEENKASAAEAERQGNRGFAAELRTAATECDAFADHIRQIDPASLGAE
jgi:hypothetical protein